MNVIFLGKFFPKNLLLGVLDDSYKKIGFSNHNFEMSIINGLCQKEDITLRCISIPGVFSFPYNNKRLFTRAEEYDYKNTTIYSTGFCNLVGIKEKYATMNCVKIFERVLDTLPEGAVHVILNTPDIRLLDVMNILRIKSNRRFTQTVIVPDIPSMVTSMNHHFFLKELMVKHRDNVAIERANASDGLVILTEDMMDFFRKPIKHIVMEGIVDVQSMDVKTQESVISKEIILYTGTLRKIFGVMNLIAAFNQIPDKNVELWICGSGDSQDAIEAASIADSRIKFLGLVDSKTALEMQHMATILVNPRTSEGDYTKYSFPSKTMEYLLAGKSVVINRLPGIPDEYYNFVYTPKDESIESLTDCLISVLNTDMNIRRKRAKEGREFIINKKNSKVQMERVLALIKTYQ